MCATILQYAYLSQLLALIVREQFDKPIDTSMDVLKSDLPLVIINRSPQQRLFAENPNPTIKAVLQQNAIDKNMVLDYLSEPYYKFLGNDLRNGKGNSSRLISYL